MDTVYLQKQIKIWVFAVLSCLNRKKPNKLNAAKVGAVTRCGSGSDAYGPNT
jgi:hypothetical protein